MANSLAAIARQRSVMATIADAITAAAVGKSLRVAVGWSNPDETAFAGQLTRALLARGLPCRCLPAQANATRPDGCPADPPGNTPMVAVITSGAAGLDETDLCRIDIHLHTPVRPAAAGLSAPSDEPDRPSRYTADHGRWPDIVVDYLDPDGPIIRHIVPALTPPFDRP
jgi:hypothetical protein